MTDTEILNTVISDLRWHVTTRRPMSPMMARDLLRTIENARCEYRHANSCSNQNVVHALGPYDGVEKCGCRRVSESPPWFPTYTPEQHCEAGHPLLCTIQPTPGAPAYVCPATCQVARAKVHRALEDSWKDITKDNQRFWRCAHHPQAIANWAHDKGWHCERGCDTNELRWSDNGTHHTT